MFSHKSLQVRPRMENFSPEKNQNIQKNFTLTRKSVWKQPPTFVRHTAQDEASAATANTKGTDVNALEEKLQAPEQQANNT